MLSPLADILEGLQFSKIEFDSKVFFGGYDQFEMNSMKSIL